MPGGLHELLSQARAGDEAARESAFAELNRLLTIFVRAAMGRRLRDHRESADVCQSIARSFIEDHREGSIGFESDAAVVAYLKVIVRTKLAMLARHDGAIKRGGGKTPSSLEHDLPSPNDPPDGPAVDLAGQEELDRVRAILDESDQELARLRLSGLDWNQIAQRLGKEPAAVRKHWSRVAQRLLDLG